MNVAILSGFMVVACALPALQAQEWSRYRGPSGQGLGVADLPAKLSEENVRWRADIGGSGHSSPVLWGEHLFLTRVVDLGGERQLVCYDATTGSETWVASCRFESHKQHKLNSFASSTPVVDDLGVYVLWTSGKQLIARAFDHDGQELWLRELGEFYAQHGSANSPVVCGDLVIIANENEGTDCFLTALKRSDGSTVWRTERQKSPRWACYSPPFLYQPVDGSAVLLVASASHGLTAVEPLTGKIRWQANVGFKNRFIATPSVAGDRVLVNTGSGGSGKECVVFQVGPTAAEEPAESFRVRRGLPYVPSVIALDERFYLFADGGFFSCVDAATGREHWRERVDGKFFSSPVSNGKAIYIGDQQGRLWTYSKSGCEVLGCLDLGAAIFATPAIARNAMFVRTTDELICIAKRAAK
jgi:outer membrane protein assembly factor BamB